MYCFGYHRANNTRSISHYVVESHVNSTVIDSVFRTAKTGLNDIDIGNEIGQIRSH